jgi:hypothetical protein
LNRRKRTDLFLRRSFDQLSIEYIRYIVPDPFLHRQTLFWAQASLLKLPIQRRLSILDLVAIPSVRPFSLWLSIDFRIVNADHPSYVTEANSHLGSNRAIGLSLLMQGDDPSLDCVHLKLSTTHFLVVLGLAKYGPKNWPSNFLNGAPIYFSQFIRCSTTI